MSTDATANVSSLPRWARRLVAAGAVVAGVGFIFWHNHFHVTASVVMLSLGWTAVVATVYLLWRVGVAGSEHLESAESWWIDATPRDELEREKRSLLRTIRDIEFDHQTGKLSDRDAEEMNRVTRARAIEVMKALDVVEADGDVRAQIELEVRARLQIEGARKAGKAPTKKGNKAKEAAQAKAASARSETAAGAVAAAQEPAPLAAEAKVLAAEADEAAAASPAAGEAAEQGAATSDEAIGAAAKTPQEPAQEPAAVAEDHGKARSSSLEGSV